MAETPSPPPSPYAPGIISEERAPPRPAGRAVVFIVATFAMTIVTAMAFWFPFAEGSTVAGGHDDSMLGLFINVSTASGALILLWAYLSDRVALWGTRREGYLLLCGLTTAITWLALAVLGRNDVAWVPAVVVLGVASTATRAAVMGGLAEISRRRASTGRLAAANIIAAQTASLVAGQLAAMVCAGPLPVAAGIAAALSLAVVVLIITLSDDGTQPGADPAGGAPVTIPQFLRSRTFWSAAAFLSIAGLATMPHETILWRVWAAHSSTIEATSWRLTWLQNGTVIATAVGYLFVCRRLPLRRLLRIALFAYALVLIAFERILHWGGLAALEGAVGAVAACDGLVYVALIDLVLRAAPRGREAFGAILLGGFPAVAAMLVTTLARTRDPSAASMARFAAAAALAACLAVSLLPRALVAPRDGERAAA
jgi:hypothetical protein